MPILDSKSSQLRTLGNPFPPQKRTVNFVPRSISSQRSVQALDIAFPGAPGDESDGSVELLPEAPNPDLRRAARIAVPSKGVILFFNLGDVFAVVAQGNYVLLHLESGSYRMRRSISAVAEMLEPYGFVRIHRSILVNRRWVEGIRSSPAGEQVLQVKGAKEFIVTRSYKKNLKSLAELWLGCSAFPDDSRRCASRGMASASISTAPQYIRVSPR